MGTKLRDAVTFSPEATFTRASLLTVILQRLEKGKTYELRPEDEVLIGALLEGRQALEKKMKQFVGGMGGHGSGTHKDPKPESLARREQRRADRARVSELIDTYFEHKDKGGY